MNRPGIIPGLLLALTLWASPAHSFCGFYVARGDAKLFNRASQVVLARDGDRTILTMANDFRGDPTEFALVVPVPTPIERGQIHVGDRAVIEHLDAYSAPRLVEYFDPDPCLRAEYKIGAIGGPAMSRSDAAKESGRERSLGVTVEARYTVGEYDILILSATQSRGLATWLRENGYGVPPRAARVLESYLKQGMRFFVAKVNLKERAKLGYANLRPLQIAYESPKFMLPIRLGMVNADGPQELFIYALTRKGRVEPTNYRTVRLAEGVELPEFVKEEFSDVYRALFAEQVRRERMEAVFLEYAWDMGWCDPCAADPLSVEELRSLGVFWLDAPAGAPGSVAPAPNAAPREVFVTRLHARYDREHFPEDLVFQETADRTNFQARYVIRHPWKGAVACEGGRAYRRSLRERRSREAQTLASLTGWDLERVLAKMGDGPDEGDDGERDPATRWWERIWKVPG
jgi:hypothetical protein